MSTMYRLRNVNFFGSGIYRGTPWPASSITRMAENAKSLSPKLFMAPAVALGHDAPDDDTQPAAGWIHPVSVQAAPDPEYPGEQILRGDVVNVPEPVAAKVRSGEFAYGSAEIYADFVTDFGERCGPLLRRFVLLGASPPQVKRLGRLPQPERMEPIAFAERGGAAQRLRPQRGLACLSFADREPALTASARAEVAKVERFAERHAESFRRGGFDPKRMGETARMMAAKNPGFKASELIREPITTQQVIDALFSADTTAATPVDRPAMYEAVWCVMPNLSQTMLDAMTDDALKEFVANLPACDDGDGADPESGNDPLMDSAKRFAEKRLGKHGPQFVHNFTEIRRLGGDAAVLDLLPPEWRPGRRRQAA